MTTHRAHQLLYLVAAPLTVALSAWSGTVQASVLPPAEYALVSGVTTSSGTVSKNLRGTGSPDLAYSVSGSSVVNNGSIPLLSTRSSSSASASSQSNSSTSAASLNYDYEVIGPINQLVTLDVLGLVKAQFTTTTGGSAYTSDGLQIAYAGGTLAKIINTTVNTSEFSEYIPVNQTIQVYTNQLYDVNMQVETATYAYGVNERVGNSYILDEGYAYASSEVDPSFTVDPSNVNAGAYSLAFSEGIGNTTLSAVPLPSSAPMFGAAVMAVGTVGYGMKRRKAAVAT